MKGEPFQPNTVRVMQIENELWLTFRQGKDFFPEYSVDMQVPIPESGWEGATLEFGGNHPTGPALRLTWPKPGSSFGDDATVRGDAYSLRLQLGRPQGKQVSGTIELQVAAPTKTSLVGSFQAELQPSPNKAPAAVDAPYVTGVLRVPGNGNGMAVAAAFYGVGNGGISKSADTVRKTFEGRPGEWAASSTSSPRLTLWYDADKGIQYKHMSLEPGEYVVALKWGNVWGAWQKVSVHPGSEIKLDLSVEESEVGKLTISLPEAQQPSNLGFGEQVPSVIPVELGFDAEVFPVDFEVSQDFNSTAPVTLPAVKAGRYLVRWRKCEAEVEVKPGEETTVTLMPKP